MKILKVTDPEFKKYGRPMAGYDFSEIVEKMQEMPAPAGAVVYEPSVAELENLDVSRKMGVWAYGESPIQVGYCNGDNHKLNAVEYHRSSEINIGATDAILLGGSEQDIEDDFTYDTSKIEAFLLPKGTAVEIYATTLHYAPCNAVGADKFRVVVVLPKGTNYPLTEKHEAGGEDALLAATNKWLIGHPEGGLPEGSFIGLKGENITV